MKLWDFKSDADIPQAVSTYVANAAGEILRAKRVLLFGSRAKNTWSLRSDYDFAIEPSPEKIDLWPEFWNKIDEYAPTLNKIDLINLATNLDTQFRLEILSTGIDITHMGKN